MCVFEIPQFAEAQPAARRAAPDQLLVRTKLSLNDVLQVEQRDPSASGRAIVQIFSRDTMAARLFSSLLGSKVPGRTAHGRAARLRLN